MRRMLLAAVLAIGLLTVTPSMALANVPSGKGLAEPFPVQCEGFGIVMVATTRGGGATAWTLDGDHIVIQAITVSAPDGTVLFSKSFGTKAGLTTFACEVDEEEDGFLVHLDVMVALVPPN
jgi:hypothetical protein